jgi:hypothetical protein
MGRTTPSPPLDVTSVFPELAPLARQAVRLHPRAGTPDEGASSLGGPLLWPAGAPWPTCGGLRLVDRREPIAPQDLQLLRELDAAVRERYYLTAAEDAQRRRIVAGAVAIDLRTGERIYPGPQPHPDPVALMGVLQLYARDVPELPFPERTDLFQLLWCPNHHAAPWWGPRPITVWRRAAEVTRPLSAPPPPRFDEEWCAMDYVPLRCVVHPERVVEYPGLRGLPGGLAERVRQWDQRHEGLYSAALSMAPGTKVGGHPWWIQGPEWPQCGCGRRMQHLLTIASGEFDERGRWLPLEDRSDPTSTAPHPYEGPDPWPPGVMLGDVGSLYLFTCTACAERPLAGTMQF